VKLFSRSKLELEYLGILRERIRENSTKLYLQKHTSTYYLKVTWGCWNRQFTMSIGPETTRILIKNWVGWTLGDYRLLANRADRVQRAKEIYRHDASLQVKSENFLKRLIHRTNR